MFTTESAFIFRKAGRPRLCRAEKFFKLLFLIGMTHDNQNKDYIQT